MGAETKSRKETKKKNLRRDEVERGWTVNQRGLMVFLVSNERISFFGVSSGAGCQRKGQRCFSRPSELLDGQRLGRPQIFQGARREAAPSIGKKPRAKESDLH